MSVQVFSIRHSMKYVKWTSSLGKIISVLKGTWSSFIVQYFVYSVLLTFAHYWAINILQVLQFLFITKLLWSFSLCKHFESPLLLSSSFLSLCKRFFNTDRLQSLFITVLLCLFAHLVACAFSVPKPLPSSSRLKYSRFDLFWGRRVECVNG